MYPFFLFILKLITKTCKLTEDGTSHSIDQHQLITESFARAEAVVQGLNNGCIELLIKISKNERITMNLRVNCVNY